MVKDLIQELSLLFGLDENSEVRPSSAAGIQSFIAGLLLQTAFSPPSSSAAAAVKVSSPPSSFTTLINPLPV